MKPVTTVVVSPRDRYTGLDECIQQLYRATPEPFELWILDLDYPRDVLAAAKVAVAGRDNVRIVSLGLKTPMDALRTVQGDIQTPSVVLLDNDSRVEPGWLPPLLKAVSDGAAVVSPLILEREGLDRGAPLRNHLHTAELRRVDVSGVDYLIEHKHDRRADPAELPSGRMGTGTFELHCVMFSTPVFKALELPSMVVREHLDISLQVLVNGGEMLVEPASVVIFDNLAERMRLSDMRFFFFRWSRTRTKGSASLFERRWGHRFYSEQAMYNWVFRRKVFLLSRWLGLPIGASNHVVRLAKRLFCRDWDPLPDPDAASRGMLVSELPRQLSHDLTPGAVN